MDEASGAARMLYELIAARRDVRHFVADAEIDERALRRILQAAHLAPSVGFSQPWDFILVRSFRRRATGEVPRVPTRRHPRSGAQRVRYRGSRAPRPARLGRDRAAGDLADECLLRGAEPVAGGARRRDRGRLGEIVEPAVLRDELALPADVEPVAYLCIGRAEAFASRPVLEETGWAERRPLDEIIHYDQFGRR
jgi:hypothetical protein